MALWPLFSVANCIPYTRWNGTTPFIHYNDYLVTLPRVYQEEIASIKGLFYEPSNDYLVAYIILNTYFWPSWACDYFYWDANTGAYLGRGGAGIINVAWANHPCRGSFNKIYTTMNSTTAIYEVPWNILAPASEAWTVDPKTWNPSTVFFYAIVNRQDGLVCGISSWDLEIWDISGIPTRKALMRLPNTLGYLAYEDRERAWIITKDGLVAKVNYQDCRWEMLSSVQNPSPDATNYFCAFDTKRNRLAVLRQRPDAEDGACQCQLEFYRPVCRAAQLTQPVPVSALKAGEIVKFASNLIGNAGEGLASYLVKGAAGVGQVLSPNAQSDFNGALCFRYQAREACTDTLLASATITDGE